MAVRELRRGGAPERADLIGDSRETLVDFSSCSDIRGTRPPEAPRSRRVWRPAAVAADRG
jgi:hypothetical protein